VLIHHPPVDRRLRVARLRDGLVDAAALRVALSPLARGLVLFGHLHVRGRCRLPTAAGALDVIAASGAALDHPHPAVRAGYNTYEIADDGSVGAVDAHVVAPGGGALERTAIPERPEWV
jgi:hypothetical protein